LFEIDYEKFDSIMNTKMNEFNLWNTS